MYALRHALYVALPFVLLMAAGGIASKQFDIVPRYDAQHRAVYHAYLNQLRSATLGHFNPCGIMWTLMAVNGSLTDFEYLSSTNNGEGSHRMMAVAYEVLRSAARVRHALQLHGNTPTICANKPIELALYMDRGIVTAHRDLLAEASCIFDCIVYFDDLPLTNITAMHANMHSSDAADVVRRLPPRVNAMKLIALFSTPYKHTMYLDGDTAPCVEFQDYSFNLLSESDIFTTLNPFGYQSTGGNPLYEGAPDHPAYKGYVEPNGGVIGFQRNERTERLFIRALELIPFFNKLGFDQDQAYLRHALFEETMLHGLRQNVQPMRKFCRFGWNCDLNTCDKGCAIIHQRWCLNYGVNSNFSISPTTTIVSGSSKSNHVPTTTVGGPPSSTLGEGSCSGIAATVDSRAPYYSRLYTKAHAKNKGPTEKSKDKRKRGKSRGG